MRRSIFLFLLLLAAVSFASPAAKPLANKILITKSTRTMTLYSGNKVLRTYKVALGTVPIGPKRVEGDHKTPEGIYTIDAKNPQSQFHLSLHISYPDAADRERARKLGKAWRRDYDSRFASKLRLPGRVTPEGGLD
ncbi:MAG TPA: L,D-transpeptidase family protein [Candidatus Angelobacter sp.]|nr:L,D-transpeptidase family protein [Candidatus Angelobacter sp.]